MTGTKRFRVEIVSRERTVYVVDAPDAEAAKMLAGERWRQGEPGDVDGFDWRELDAIGVSAIQDAAGQAQDEEVVIRFIRERERLLLRLGSGIGGPSGNDAISAARTAMDLGWSRSDGISDGPDTVRAAETLERLCAKKRLVSFRRTRERADEQGEILLYCTPEYLDHLSTTLDEGMAVDTA